MSNPFLFAITFTNLVCSQSQSSCRAVLPGGGIQPRLICYHIYQPRLQSISIIMPCYSPKGCPTPFYSAGATDKFCLQSIPVIMQYRATLPGVVQPRFICYRIYQSHLQLNSSHHTVLLSHHAAGGEPEDGFAARKALSPIGIGRYGFCRTGVVMDWSNKSDEIYFNHFYYDKTTKTACFTRRTTPPPNSHPTPKNKKKELKQCEYLSSRK